MRLRFENLSTFVRLCCIQNVFIIIKIILFAEDSYQQQCRVDEESVHLDILDTAGQVCLRYKDAHLNSFMALIVSRSANLLSGYFTDK